jgi:cytochrome b pre-mRNA-processing protein 3
MILALFRSRANRRLIDRLHGEIVAAARHPALYREFGVADTFEGRFELVVLHAFLVVRRLNQLPAPAPEMAQDLVDAVFAHFDVALREAGVGDLAVPKRMKRLAAAFYGRVTAYDLALQADGDDELAAALTRNTFGPEGGTTASTGAPLLGRYVRVADAALAAASIGAFESGGFRFPDPVAAAERAP